MSNLHFGRKMQTLVKCLIFFQSICPAQLIEKEQR